MKKKQEMTDELQLKKQNSENPLIGRKGSHPRFIYI